MQNKTHKKGMLMALVPATLGIVLWLVMWHMGYIPALAAIAIVYGTHWFYGKWGGRISRKELIQVMSLAVVAIIIAFLISFVLDVWSYYTGLYGGQGNFLAADFWSLVLRQFGQFESYGRDLGLTVLFTGLAIVSLVYDKRRARDDKKADEIAKKL